MKVVSMTRDFFDKTKLYLQSSKEQPTIKMRK